jgi:hypothetical protein
LPGPGELVELAVHPSEIPPGLHPITEEVVALLDEPRLLDDLLDRCRATDLEAMRAVSALLEHGYARRAEGPAPEREVAPLLGAHELHALRARIARGRSSGAQAVGKVVVAGGGPLARRTALGRFETIPGFERDPAASDGFGTVGRLALGDGVRVDVAELPAGRAHRPLWRPFAAGAIGALVLLPADDDEPLLAELARGLRLPIVVCGPPDARIPQAVRGAPGGFAFQGSDAAEAMRALLAGAAARPA